MVTYGVIEEFDEAISAWKESIDLQPSSPDAHTSWLLPSTYVNPETRYWQTSPVHI